MERKCGEGTRGKEQREKRRKGRVKVKLWIRKFFMHKEEKERARAAKNSVKGEVGGKLS